MCRIVDAETGDPARAEGLFYQLIVRLHRFSLGRDDYALSRHWQRGLVLDDEYNGRALLELLSGDVRITTRAAYPGFFLHQLSQEVKWLAEHFWKGLRCQITVPCSHPCGVDDPGRGLFEVGKLIESRRRGRLDYPCPIPKCDVWQNINALLANAPMPQADDLAALLKEGLAELRRGQKEIKQAAHGDYQALDARLRERMSQADEQFAAVMTTLTDEGRDGPRLFSLRPVRPDRWDMPGWRSQKIRLTLWCEHSRLPLPVLWGDATRGVYVFEQPREWLVKAAPLAQFMAGMLNLVLPVAGSAVQWALDETTFKKIQDDLDLSIQSFSALLGAGGAASQWLLQANATRLPEDADQTKPHQTRRDHVRSYGWLKAAQGSLLREMQTLLRDRDPGFGGLKRVQNKRNEFLWIHPRFEKEYYPDPPIMPPPEQ